MFKSLFCFFFTFLFLVTCHLLLATPIYAANEFATTYDVVYDIDESGITTVTEKITLKNLTSQYYASEFKLTIGATQIFDVKGTDSNGTLEVKSKPKDNLSEISTKFNSQIAGLGKIMPWTLQFKSKDFAQNLGKVWEVRAPRISSTTNLESYVLTLAVPLNFGEPTLISPTPKSQTKSQGKIFLTFDQDQLKVAGVSASFGTNQLFDFDLSYHLENNNLVPILTNIALPPDTPYQDVIFRRIDPKPINVTIDDDGNYLAWYKLKRNQKLDVKVFGSAKLYTNSKVKNPTLHADLRKKYTQSDKYWEKDHPQIIAKLKEIVGNNPPKETHDRVKLIYLFVVNYLKYDSSRINDSIERFGAVTALNNPNSAVCMEFTDLFIALARSAGIPARELDGYAYSANTALRPLSLTKDILHAWPQYFDDKKGWIMVDPTWENTTDGVDYFNKLDLNHFTFVVKGTSSTQPVPAGSYKYTGEDSQDVKVTLSGNDFLGKGQIDVQIDAQDPILAGFPGKIKINVVNVGDSFFSSTNLSLNSNKLTFLDSSGKNSGPIPAFGQASFDFNIRTESLFDNFNDQIIVSIGDRKFVKNVTIKPLLIFQKIPLIIAAIILVSVVVYILVLGGLLYRKKVIKIQKK
ncbi:transglutaminase domain-containing protein [Candidatus Daviesbacteria bacterium]|nr:transglutaminase domain-containing protein [Candidatus Daviesbacteria bacterium]